MTSPLKPAPWSSPNLPTPIGPPASHLVRWVVSFAAFGVPQAAAPIAFSLVALPLTGNPASGAAMVLAMTLAQVVGAVPVARVGARLNPVGYLRILVAFRTLALSGIALLAWLDAAFPFLVAASALAGLVSGAAYGFQRSLLNHLVVPARLPRALGIAATLNEVTFVAAPVVASLLGAAAPITAIVLFALMGAAPLLLVPQVEGLTGTPPRSQHGRLVTPTILLWLGCAASTAAAVAAVEIGAVTLAVDYGIGPGWAFLFTVPLCIASIAGGVWVSAANRSLGPRTVVFALGATVLGSTLVAAHASTVITTAGAVIIGAFLAPLQTHYSLTLDRVAPAGRRAEVFALLRTANSVGVIFASALLAVVPLQPALMACTALVLIGTLNVIITTRRNGRPSATADQATR